MPAPLANTYFAFLLKAVNPELAPKDLVAAAEYLIVSKQGDSAFVVSPNLASSHEGIVGVWLEQHASILDRDGQDITEIFRKYSYSIDSSPQRISEASSLIAEADKKFLASLQEKDNPSASS